MNGKHSNHGFFSTLGPEARAFSPFPPTRCGQLTYELQKHMHTLGPMPKRCLESFVDLGLSDTEIARYFKIPRGVVRQLREVWEIDGAL